MQDSVNSQSRHGGARKGAGRKSGDNPRNIRASFMLSSKAADALREAAERENCSRNDILNRILESL